MDLRAYYIQAAEEAAAAVHTTEDDVPKLAAKAVVLKLEVQGIGLGGDADDAPALPRYGKSLSGQGNGVAPMGMDNDKAAEGGGARDLTCPECGKAFLSDKAMYGHLRCHPEKGYRGATRPADAATAAMVGGKKPRKVPRKEAEFSTMSPTASAAVSGDKKPKKVPWKEAELSTRWPATAKRGRVPPTANAESAAPVAVLQSICSEEEAAMILLDMSSRGQTPEPELPMQPVHVADAVAEHQMPGVEQPMLPDHVADAVEMHHELEVEQPMVPDRHVAGAVSGQHMWGAEKPAQLEHVFKVVMEPQAAEAERVLRPEHVAKVTAEPQTPEVKKHMKLEPVTDAVLVVVRTKNGGPADKPVSPGAKKPKKRRLHDLEQTPASPPPEAADVKKPARRIPSPASDRRYGCPTCHNKTFPTHQALGGHMASHNKGKYGGAQHVDGLAVAHAVNNIMAHHHSHSVIAAAAGLGEERREYPLVPMAQSPAHHPCSRCHLTFPTGQALGGHMRKHWLADKLLAKAAAAPSGVPRDFDLNELPRNEGEKEN